MTRGGDLAGRCRSSGNEGRKDKSRLTFRFGFGLGPDRFTGFRATPEPRTGLWVQFSPYAELWTRPGSSSPKFRTELRQPYFSATEKSSLGGWPVTVAEVYHDINTIRLKLRKHKSQKTNQ